MSSDALEELAVSFVKPIDYGELERFFCELHKRTGYSISTRTEECSGWGETNPSGSINPNKKVSSRKVTGTARKNTKSIAFAVQSDYDDSKDGEDNIHDDIMYTGLEFEVTPGYELDELSSDSKKVMEGVKDAVRAYIPRGYNPAQKDLFGRCASDDDAGRGG